MIRFILIFFSLIIVCSCAKKANSEIEVYNNNFDNDDLTNIFNGTIETFNGSKVLGTYNNSGFSLNLKDLPTHDLVDISFDLYIHDSWEGTQQLQNNINGPDLWQLKIDNNLVINTTFNNYQCVEGNICPPQSYPANYPNASNNPKTGASRTDLPGFCSWASSPNGSTLYRIQKTIRHSDNAIIIECLDQLKQKNVSDPKCDESWSIDNIKVKVVSVK